MNKSEVKEFIEMLKFQINQCELLLINGEIEELDFGSIVMDTLDSCSEFEQSQSKSYINVLNN